MTTPTLPVTDEILDAFMDSYCEPNWRKLPQKVIDEWRKKFGLAIQAALTSAAQVGEQTYTQRQADSMVRQTWAATIERCAQVAEDWGLGRVNQTVKDYPATCAAAIAYAIRKLKDIDPDLVYPGKDPDFVFPEEKE